MKANIDKFLEERNMDKKQVLVIAGVGIIFICLVAYGVVSLMSDEETVVTQNDSLEVPEGKELNHFDTKLEAYGEKERKEKEHSLDFDQSGIFGNDSVDGEPTKRKLLEMQVDSVLNLNRMSDSESPPTRTPTRNGRTKIKRESSGYSKVEKRLDDESEFEESALSMDDFFDIRPMDDPSDLSKKKVKRSTGSNQMIFATIRDNQTIKDGSRITMMLSKEAIIDGKRYPRNTIIYGISSFKENRVYTTIKKINHNPVDLHIYDAQDGLEGIYIEGANAVGEVAKEATGDAVGDVNVAGVPVGDAVKRIFNKRQRETKVQLLNDYRLIIKSKE